MVAGTFQTGRTKTQRGTSLVSRLFESPAKEQVCFLLQARAKADDVRQLEKECVDILQHALLETEGDASQRLDGALKELNGLLKGLTLTSSLEDVHMIIALVDSSGFLHVSHAGRAEAYIVRAGSATQVTEYMKGKPVPLFIHIASGKLEPRDTLLFSTYRLLRVFTPAQLAQFSERREDLLDEIEARVEAEGEQAALALFRTPAEAKGKAAPSVSPLLERSLRQRGRRLRGTLPLRVPSFFSLSLGSLPQDLGTFLQKTFSKLQGHATSFFQDLAHPQRKHRAHLLLLASVLGALLIVWAVVNLSIVSQRGKTKAELMELIAQVDVDLKTAENRRIAGDIEAANAILLRAEEHVEQVLGSETGLFRVEALDLLGRVRAKQEEIGNIVRLSPRVVVELSTKKPEITVQGFVGTADGEFVVYDQQDLLRVLLNAIDDPKRLSDEATIVDGAFSSRYQVLVFLLTGDTVMELTSEQPVVVKTEDPAGWASGTDIEAYLRYLYLLSPEDNQIYKYERLGNRYGAPLPYNVNGDLRGAIDMSIDANVYVLKKGGEALKLFRGEVQPLSFRLLPEGALVDTTRLFKVFDGNFYFLDPVGQRVIVTGESGAAGESTYLRQYILEGDQLGELKDLYVDPDEVRLYVLDEKRVYAIDL